MNFFPIRVGSRFGFSGPNPAEKDPFKPDPYPPFEHGPLPYSSPFSYPDLLCLSQNKLFGQKGFFRLDLEFKIIN